MPTYQYACKECDHQFEAVQSFTESSLTDCPECSGPLRKLFGSVGVIFKGSGFYRNDSRSGTKKADATTAASATSNSSGSGDKKSSESKSGAATTTAKSSAKATAKVS